MLYISLVRSLNGEESLKKQEKEQSEIANPHQDFFWEVYFFLIVFQVNPIWLPNHVTYDIICVTFVPHGKAVICVKFRLDLFSLFREEDFWRFKKKKNQYGCQITWLMTSKIFVEHFIPRWPSKMCILIRCSVLHMHLWRHNEGKDLWCHKNTTLIPQEECLLCATGTPIAWGTLVWSFPSICPAILEKIFKK